ncbi:hypothetical protein DB30_01325 [Enhygromyxa salina]|uniref:Uncharacterized protein n=1 Tax=Enhygromyxa salina TaxID=215803 RepID=A0A0C2CPB2_9BACT|nr:hypothetical protein DB30_03276 [Enhygromyxa salina]KIG12508.1 hypothetical protein DB30_01325 [Enhygromyxa salina]
MSRSARIPKVDRNDPNLQKLARLMGELADERCGPSADFQTRSKAMQAAGEEALQLLAQQRSVPEDKVK